jgi:hypothetical protein
MDSGQTKFIMGHYDQSYPKFLFIGTKGKGGTGLSVVQYPFIKHTHHLSGV